MHAAALRALEFDRIVDAVRGYALTPMGDERLARLAPSTSASEVASLLAATTQTARYITTHGGFPLRATADLPGILGALGVEGRALEAPRLLALASFLDSVDDTRTAVHRVASEYPLVDRAGATAASFKGEIARTRAAIDPAGDVVDDASPQLRGIRDKLRRQKSRLRGTLESYLRGKDTSKYLQDQVVTERNGRYVIVVKAEHRGGIPGIVHGASASGASLYLEPLSTVDINNDIVALEEQEAEEVRRILLALTEGFRSRPDDVAQTVAAATELDVLQARARFSESIDGVEPKLSRDGAFELLAARHPLLKSPVPVTVRILPPATVLLITGPNTGGKTVALKTAGLLALMAQSGLRIPVADGSRLPVFRTVFADIGDEQSIEASLSTFSAHITNIASMDRDLAVPGLVLLDEIGSGTDPIEGGALGVAVIDHFRRRGATLIATSHYDALKSYASTTDGVQSAAFGFNAQTFAPTYELIYGSPGRSLALEIAGRLGLSPAVIAAARQNLTTREAQLAEHLAKIDHDMRALEHDRRLAAREREALASSEERLRAREEALREREEASRKRMAAQLDEQVREARKQIDGVIAKLKQKTQAIADEASRRSVNTGASGAARLEAREALDAVVARVVEPSAAQAVPLADPPQPVTVGAKVVFGSLGLEGVVTAIHNDTAEVDVRGKRMRSAVRDLRVIGTAATPASRVSVHVDLHPRESTPSELNVIGCTVDEALTRAERFMDESLLNDLRVLRFVHGHGTGQLKKAIGRFLQQHPLVASVSPAPPNQGGGGVTIAELKGLSHMALFPQSFIDDLKLHANIVQVIQDYVSLKRVGRTYKGLCPFHGEKTPSFHVDPEKGFFHCFGCSVGGDVIKFLELHEKVGFADAVKMLAQKTGMAMPEPTETDPAARQDAALREAMLKIHEVAAVYFREQLAGPAGARARQQLRDRGVSAQTIEQLGLGFAPQAREGLKARLAKQGFSQALVLQSGLVLQRDSGELVDRFRNRLMIPICRDTGSIIAFGGRSMEPDQVPKYLNSPETPIYSKSRTLYGLNLSKAAIRKLGYAVMVEGYFDYAQVHQAQAAPVVATCGTALTPAQVQLLRRFTTRVVLSFDPDSAGQGAAVRSSDLLVAEGFDVNVLVLNKGEDPDTFIRHNGPEAYRERLRTSRPYLEYLLEQAANGVDFTQDEARRQFLSKMLTVAAKIPEAAARDQFADRIAFRARVTEDVVRAEIRKAAVQKRTEVTPREMPVPSALKPAEKGLLWALVHNSRQGLSALDELDGEDLAHLAARMIFEMVRSLQETTPPEGLPSALLQRLSTENARIFTAVAAIDQAPALSPMECARAIKRMRWQRERAEIQREIDRLQRDGSGGDSQKIDVLLRKKNDLGLRIEQLT